MNCRKKVDRGANLYIHQVQQHVKTREHTHLHTLYDSKPNLSQNKASPSPTPLLSIQSPVNFQYTEKQN